jgi:hypothetical protein
MDRRDFLKLGILSPAAYLACSKVRRPEPTDAELFTANAFIRATFEAQAEPEFPRRLQQELDQHEARVIGKRDDPESFTTLFYLEGAKLPRRPEGCPACCMVFLREGGVKFPSSGGWNL